MADEGMAGLRPVGEVVMSEATEDGPSRLDSLIHGHVSDVLDLAIHVAEQRAAADAARATDADARECVASLLDNMVESVSTMAHGEQDAAAVGAEGGSEDGDGDGVASVAGSAGEDVGVGGGGWWRWLFSSLGVWMMLAVVSVTAGVWLDRYMTLPRCSGNSIGPRTVPLAPGECIEWDGGFRGLLRLVPGVKSKSRLTVTDGGGLYLGPDGVEIPIGDIMLESQTGGGLLCDAEKIVRKAAGVSPFFTARTSRSRLVFGAGTFCTSYSTPPPPSLFDELRQGEARFSDTGDLEVVGRRGMVVWSAAADSVVGAGGRSDRNAGEKDRLSNAAAEVEGWEILAGD